MSDSDTVRDSDAVRDLIVFLPKMKPAETSGWREWLTALTIHVGQLAASVADEAKSQEFGVALAEPGRTYYTARLVAATAIRMMEKAAR